MNTSNILPPDIFGSPQQTSESLPLLEDHVENDRPQVSQPRDPEDIGVESGEVRTRPVRFKIRIADLDYYMAEPGPLDIDSCQFLPPMCPVLKVPVVRVYGANEAGQKTCLHIHQAYPYFYIPYEGSLEPTQLQSYIQQLGLSMNHAACITFNTPQDPRRSQFVAAIVPVKGIPFYGYHVGYSNFLKIYLFNPDFETRIVDLMRSGAIMGTRFQPFESHIPFRLQFFVDFNLYGMGWLELEEALLRSELPPPRPDDNPKRLTTATVPDTRIWSPDSDPGRISFCEIEMDSTVNRIVNRDKALERQTHHSLGECFKPPSLTAQVPSMAGLWEDDSRRRHANNLPTQELPKTQIRDPASVPWLNHDLNKQMVADLVREIMSQSQTKTPTQGDFDNYKIDEDPLAASFMTAYQSVDYLCPRVSSDPDTSFDAQETSFVYNEGDSTILVDESIISQAGVDLDEEHMDTRRQIFRGLTGLGGIEEQEEDFQLADLADLRHEDFQDDGWSEVEADVGRDIPQFDGGGDDDSQRDDRKRKAPADEWKKVVRASGRKKGRSPPPPSLSVSKEDSSSRPRRSCYVISTTSTTDSSTRSSLPRSSKGSTQSGNPGTPIYLSTDDSFENDGDVLDTSMEVDFADQEHRHSEQDPVNRHSRTSALTIEYPEPASPERKYFLSAMDELWSSPSPSMERPSLILPPLLPSTPVHNPLHSTDSSSPVTQRSQHDQTDSEIVHQTFMEDAIQTQDEALDTLQTGGEEDRRRYGLMEREGGADESVMVEDSVIYEQFDPAPTQSASLESRFEETPVESSPVPQVFKFSITPPTTYQLLSSLPEHGLPNVIHQKPHFSVESDVPSKAKVFGGKEFRLQSTGLKTMQRFNSDLDVGSKVLPGEGFRFWAPIQRPPSRAEAQEWLKQEVERTHGFLRSTTEASTQKRREQISQIEGPTQKNAYGSKNTPTKVAASVAVEKDFLDVLSLEVHCQTRGGLLPDPKVDPILAVFYCWQTERDDLVSNGWVPGYRVGMFTHSDAGMMDKLATNRSGFDVHMSVNEEEMMNMVIEHVRRLDPDILAGYEVHNLSWGYIVERYQTLFEMDMTKLLSRVRPPKAPVLTRSARESKDSFNSTHNSGLKFIGRHLFNVWRLIRGEVALTNYSFCNVVFHVLQQRVPHYTHETLSGWWSSGRALYQSRVIRHYLHRVQYSLQLIESQELISRTSEFARVFGVDFFSVISRGSQYKVESMMIRLAKPENYIMISPSRAQVAGQRALEVIPMVMEPESGFYEDPVVVLDFQSLYPSVMIAYNICYSTCLGKLGGGSKLGVTTEYEVRDGILPLMEEHLHIAPNNVMYVNQDIRRGLLGRMLAEILDTRVMVKKAMKEYPNNKSLLKLLEARQLSLKFIANVTYGYTSASYSGRMPGVEIADSIVLSGRETLERSIRFVNNNPTWNARVVYGDTDSMFVQLKGRTRQEAFEIGYDIAETITRMNPRPVKLKFEKVYHPCFLVTKKRYVGSSYETPDQQEPIFDAKGIETIRRDGVPAVQKIMETCIKIMFRTQDLSLVKSYFVRQLAKILEGRVPIPDLMFGKEVRIGGYSEKGVPPPGAIVSARRMEEDHRAEPQYGERVPYVVVYGDPGARLTDQVVEPKELIRNKDLRLNGEYYIRKQIIPSMERIFQLAGADVKSWYEEMPRIHRAVDMTLTGAVATSTGSSSLPGSRSGFGPTDVVPTEATSAMIAAQQDTYHSVDGANTGSVESGDMNNGGRSKEDAPTESTTLEFGPIDTSHTSDALSKPPRFMPRRKGGKGFVSLGSRIDRYYQSQLCVLCGKLVGGQKQGKDLCTSCTSEHNRGTSMVMIQNRLAKAEKLFRATIDTCSSCCRASPITAGGGADDAKQQHGDNGGGKDLIACESFECSVFWQRRKAQDSVFTTWHLTERIMKELEEPSRP
ncbi:hypothetical protein B0O80DRAFT_502930 [Mortierella sp. GBAus27b]|nr:DNA polymerase zeta [Mortierella sp. GBA43]KAI8347139.1 hypothetical protein B0O80DRAFT_502930 [Mortierella sp. GBAus27b]